MRPAGDDHMGPRGEAPAQQGLHQLQRTGLLPRAVPGGDVNNDKHGDNVIMSHSLVVEAGQLGHPSDLVQAVYQEQQPTLGGNLGTRQLQSCHIMEKIISLGFS